MRNRAMPTITRGKADSGTATMILLGSGLPGLAAYGQRRRKANLKDQE